MIFLLPPLVGLAVFNVWRRKSIPGFFLSVVLICLIAFVYTTPWDNFLVSLSIWGYPADRVLGTWGHVPYEEYAFFILQPLLTASWMLALLSPKLLQKFISTQYSQKDRASRFWGVALMLVLTYWGAAFLTIPQGTYLGLILVWAGPVIAFQWIYGGHLLWRMKKLWFWSWFPPTLYLWVADRIAIGQGIWFFSEYQTSGLHFWGLPLEEALFFLVTNLMVVQGLLLYQTTLLQHTDSSSGIFRRFLHLLGGRSSVHG